MIIEMDSGLLFFILPILLFFFSLYLLFKAERFWVVRVGWTMGLIIGVGMKDMGVLVDPYTLLGEGLSVAVCTGISMLIDRRLRRLPTSAAAATSTPALLRTVPEEKPPSSSSGTGEPTAPM